jgi:ferredoxin
VEGALQIVDGKARLVKDAYCDGLGACIGECPEGAITLIEREAEAFDEEAAEKHAEQMTEKEAEVPFVCPGVMATEIERPPTGTDHEPSETTPSERSNWPVQLNLVPPAAPYFQHADLLVVADCVPFAVCDFHSKFLHGRIAVVGCPKFDDVGDYVEKLTAIFKQASIKSLTVVRMEVPCCSGLVRIVQSAMAASGKDIPFKAITLSIRGEEV